MKKNPGLLPHRNIEHLFKLDSLQITEYYGKLYSLVDIIKTKDMNKIFQISYQQMTNRSKQIHVAYQIN